MIRQIIEMIFVIGTMLAVVDYAVLTQDVKFMPKKIKVILLALMFGCARALALRMGDENKANHEYQIIRESIYRRL